jgi:hypothetical protein
MASGYKNVVISVPDHEKLVLRVGFYSTSNGSSISNCTLNYRGDEVVLFHNMMEQWVVQLQDSFQRSVIKLMLDNKISITNRDIVLKNDILLEYETASSCNIVSKSFNVIIPNKIAEFLLPPTNITELNIVMVAEYSLKMDGSLQSVNLFLSEYQCLRVVLGYFSDQLKFFSEVGHFHNDGHAGNLLFRESEKRLEFFWSDFGKTSSKGDVYSGTGFQLRNSLISLHKAFEKYFKGYHRVKKLFEDIIATETNGYSIDKLKDPSTISDILKATKSYIMKVYNSSEFIQLAKELSEETTFAFEYLSNRIDTQDQIIASQNITIQNLERKVESQSQMIESQNQIIASQNIKIQNVERNMESQSQSQMIKSQAQMIESQNQIIASQNIKIQNVERNMEELYAEIKLLKDDRKTRGEL